MPKAGPSTESGVLSWNPTGQWSASLLIYAWKAPRPKDFLNLSPDHIEEKKQYDARDKAADTDVGAEEWTEFDGNPTQWGGIDRMMKAVARAMVKRAKRAFWDGQAWGDYESDERCAYRDPVAPRIQFHDGPGASHDNSKVTALSNNLRLIAFGAVQRRLREEIWLEPHEEPPGFALPMPDDYYDLGPPMRPALVSESPARELMPMGEYQEGRVGAFQRLAQIEALSEFHGVEFDMSKKSNTIWQRLGASDAHQIIHTIQMTSNKLQTPADPAGDPVEETIGFDQFGPGEPDFATSEEDEGEWAMGEKEREKEKEKEREKEKKKEKPKPKKKKKMVRLTRKKYAKYKW